ncbi:MAG: hypothetical protein WCP09_02780 [Candidatus Taylorbacteria bacterium]
MIYQRHYSIRGVILVDILLALSVCLIFVISLSESSAYSRDIFFKARERTLLLDHYDEIVNSSSTFQSTTTDGLIAEVGKIPYGNHLDEIDTFISTIPSSSTSSGLSLPMIKFTSISARSPLIDPVSDQPVCAVDFGDSTVVGSYEWYKHRDEYSTRSIASSSEIIINIVTYTLPINPSIPLTDVQVRNDVVYVSADSNVSLDPDIFIFRIRQNAGVDLLSYLNTGPGLSSLSVAGKYIYGAAPSTVGQLHVMMQSPSHGLSLVKRFQLPLPYATATPALGSTVSFANDLIYIGTEKWLGDELLSIDVHDPESPREVAGYEIGSKVNDIYILDNIAYVSTANEKQLQIFNTSNMGMFESLSSFSPSGWQRQEGKITTLFENALSFGRTSGGYNTVTEHELLQFAASTSGTTIGSYTLPSYQSLDMPGGVYGILRDRQSIYVITRQIGSEFQIYSNELNASTSMKYSLPSSPQAMTCYLDKIYVLSHTKPELYEISINRKIP